MSEGSKATCWRISSKLALFVGTLHAGGIGIGMGKWVRPRYRATSTLLIPSSDEVSLFNWNWSFQNANAGKLIDDVTTNGILEPPRISPAYCWGEEGPFTTTTTINPRSFSPREFRGVDSGSFIISLEITSGAMPRSRESSSRNDWYLAKGKYGSGGAWQHRVFPGFWYSQPCFTSAPGRVTWSGGSISRCFESPDQCIPDILNGGLTSFPERGGCQEGGGVGTAVGHSENQRR